MNGRRAVIGGLAATVAATRLHAETPRGLSVTYAHAGDADAARIGTYVSSERGFVTSSYWIDAPDGLTVIDTQFLLSAAEELLAASQRATSRKAVRALVLHPNPDKFNGAAVLVKRGVQVATSAAVLAAIPAVHELRKTWFYERFKPDYPADVPKIESIDPAATFGPLTLHRLGRGCSAAHVVAQLGTHVFPGDLVTNGFHAWLELGRLEDWLQRIAEIKALKPEFVHPGRGPSGTADLLDAQESYLRRVIALIRDAQKRTPVEVPDKQALETLQDEIVAAFPGLRYDLFVWNGLEACWRSLWATHG